MLRATRRDVRLDHCIGPIVPFSTQNLKMILIIILPRNTAPQNLMSLPSRNFFIQNFQDFTLYVNMEKRNTECRSDQGQVVWMRGIMGHIRGDVEDHSLREQLRSCQHFLVDSEIERARHKVFSYAVETLNETIVNEKLYHFFNKFKCAAK